jgi:hypothetical protein
MAANGLAILLLFSSQGVALVNGVREGAFFIPF